MGLGLGRCLWGCYLDFQLNLQVRANFDAETILVTTAQPLPRVWSHVVVAFESNTIRLFINDGRFQTDALDARLRILTNNNRVFLIGGRGAPIDYLPRQNR